MENNWSKALRASISDVFSTMFFMVPEWDPELLPELGPQKAEGWHQGMVVVSRQQVEIGLWVWCPPQVSRDLAANILAQDPGDLESEQILDAFREMINMVAGGVLTTVDPQGSWTMGLPQSNRCGEGTLGQLLASTKEQMAFNVDDQPVLAGLSIQAA
jgi:hypothetical protein